jgi:hypothetical protein
MVSIIGNDLYEVVFGSRILGGGALRGGMPLYKYISNRVLTFFQNLLLGKKLSEYHTGFRAFSSYSLNKISYNKTTIIPPDIDAKCLIALSYKAMTSGKNLVAYGTCSGYNVVGIPGTNFKNIKDIIANINGATFDNYKSGFDNLKNFDFKTYDFCAGYSLGGAIATIAAAYFGKLLNTPDKGEGINFKTKDKTKKRIICYTIGSPRVGNTEFVKWFHTQVDESMRIANDDDPITLFPISCLYTHISEGLCLSDKCIKEVHSDIKWYWRLISFPFYKASAKDHSCNIYISRLMAQDKLLSNIKRPSPV